MIVGSSSTVSFTSRHIFSVLSESGGLRARVSLSSVSEKHSRVSRLRRGVVCEAEDTATRIPVVNDSTWEDLVLKADGVRSFPTIMIFVKGEMCEGHIVLKAMGQAISKTV